MINWFKSILCKNFKFQGTLFIMIICTVRWCKAMTATVPTTVSVRNKCEAYGCFILHLDMLSLWTVHAERMCSVSFSCCITLHNFYLFHFMPLSPNKKIQGSSQIVLKKHMVSKTHLLKSCVWHKPNCKFLSIPLW